MTDQLAPHLQEICDILEEFAGRLNAETEEALRAAEDHTVKASESSLLALELVDSFANGLHDVAKAIEALHTF